MKSESFVMVSKDVGSSVCNNRQRRKSFLSLVMVSKGVVSSVFTNNQRRKSFKTQTELLCTQSFITTLHRPDMTEILFKRA